ncbi:hypothetical protein LXL04_011247 [Taraxacum kok-saghyz]
MENLKKKRSEKVRAGKEHSDGRGTTDDAELEEFFAILRRLRAGYDYFQKKGTDDGGGKSAASQPATGSGLWDPAFELEDFNQLGEGSREITDGEALQKDGFVGFDLNADPETNQKFI